MSTLKEMAHEYKVAAAKLAMALSLAACGGGKTETPSDSNTPADNTSAEPTKLSLILRGGTYADVIKECLPAFEAEHNVVCLLYTSDAADEL